MANDIYNRMMSDYYARQKRDDAVAEKVRKKSDRGFSFGDLIPNFGIGNAWKELSAIPAGLWNLGGAVVTGDTGTLAKAGKGLVSSVLSTAKSLDPTAVVSDAVGLPDLWGSAGAALLGEEYRPKSVWEHTFGHDEGDRGFLGPAIEAVGNISAAGAVAKGIGAASDVGRVANAARTAEAATAAGYAAEDIARAARLSTRAGRVAEKAAGGLDKTPTIADRVLREAGKAARKAEGLDIPIDTPAVLARQKFLARADAVAHPYRSVAHAAGDVGKAAIARRISEATAAGEDFTDAAAAVDDAAKVVDAADAVGATGAAADKARRATLFDEAAYVADVADPDSAAVGGAQATSGFARDIGRALDAPPAPWAEKIAGKLSPGLREMTERYGGWTMARQVNRARREFERAQEVTRRKLFMGPTVQALVGDETKKLVGQTLPDGTKITPAIADMLVGDEAIARASGERLLEDTIRNSMVRAGAPIERLDEIRAEWRLSGARSKQMLPTELLYETDDAGRIVGETDLSRAIDAGVDAYRRQAREAHDIAMGSRLGDRGIAVSDIADPVKWTKGQRRRYAKAGELADRAEHFATEVAARERARWERSVDERGDTLTRLGKKIAHEQETVALALGKLDETRTGLPKVLRTEAARTKVVDDIVAGVTEGDGSVLYDLHRGGVVDPSGGATFAVGVSPAPSHGVQLGADAAENAMLMRQQVEGAFRIYQETLTDPDVSLVGYIDDENRFHVQPAQYSTTERGGVRPLTRDEAMLLAAARNQPTVGVVGDSGRAVETAIPPDVAAQLSGNMRARTRTGTALRFLADKKGLPPETVDRWMAAQDIMAVRAYAVNPGRWKNPGAVYAKIAQRAIAAAKKGEIPATAGVAVGDFFGAEGATRSLVRFQGAALREILGPGDARRFERALGVVDGKWTPQVADRFATAFEAYLAGGDAPAKFAPYFDPLRAALGDVWDGVREMAPSDHVRDLFDDMLGDYRTLDAPEVPTPARVGDELSGAVRQRGEKAAEKFARTRRQRAQQKLPNEAEVGTHEAYRRGVVGGEALAKAEAAQRKIVELEALKKRVYRNLDSLRQTLLDHDLPAEKEARRLNALYEKSIAKLIDELDHPSGAQVSARWGPLWKSIEVLHKYAEDRPDLAELLEDVPTGMREMLKFADENGFDPTYIGSISDGEVRRMVSGHVTLGAKGREGQIVEGGFRKARRNPNLMNRSVAALAAGYLRVTHEHNSNALATFIEDHATKPYVAALTEGPGAQWVPWDEARNLILSGETVASTLAPPKYMVPKAVFKSLKNMNADYHHGAFGLVSRMMDPWRVMVLTMSPRWYVNNFVSNAILATAEGVKLSDWSNAWRSWRQSKDGARVAEPFADIPGVTGSSIVSDLMRRSGTLVDFPTKGAARMARKMEGNWPGFKYGLRKIGRANEVVDEIARAAVYHRSLRGGLTAEQALNRAYQALVDYNDLTPFERSVVKSVVPFYAWQKGILKLTGRLAADHPIVLGVGAQLGNLNRDLLRDKYGVDMPSGYLGLINLPGLGMVNTRGMNPFQDAFQLTTPNGIAQSMGPFVETALRAGLDAPASGFPEHRRVDEWGRAIPTTDPLEDLADIGEGLPMVRALRGLAGDDSKGNATGGSAVEKFVGVNRYNPEQIAKIIERAQKSQRTMSGGAKPKPATTGSRALDAYYRSLQRAKAG